MTLIDSLIALPGKRSSAFAAPAIGFAFGATPSAASNEVGAPC